MNRLCMILMVALAILLFTRPTNAESLPGESIAEEILIEGMIPTPKKVISTLKFLIELETIKDPVLKDAAKAKFGSLIIVDSAINVAADNLEKQGLFNPDGALGKYKIGKYQLITKNVFKSLLHTAVNMITLDIGGQALDQLFIVSEEWKETVAEIDKLPDPDEFDKLGIPMDPELRFLYQIVKGRKSMASAAKQIPIEQRVNVSNFSIESALQDFKPLAKVFAPLATPFVPVTNPLLDASQIAQRTSQQQLTPVNVSFTETFNGLFTQNPDSLGSRGGNHSGTITDGTRVGTGSRPGQFTSGSFSGRTMAEPGYTPVTHTNAPFSGTSVGTAKGFREGDLKGTMTVTVPTGTQTVTVSGSITINKDGSLSMPSYSGPVTDNGTGQRVGTMSGSWNQGATR